jgi:hypothetical protein
VSLPAIHPVFLTDGDQRTNYTIGLSDRQSRDKPLAPVFESSPAGLIILIDKTGIEDEGE